MKIAKSFKLKTLLAILLLLLALPLAAQEAEEFANDEAEEEQPPVLIVNNHIEYLFIAGILFVGYKFHGRRKGRKRPLKNRLSEFPDEKTIDFE